jgi:hypothetical protein
MLKNIRDSKKDTKMYTFTFPLLSFAKKEISSLLDNASISFHLLKRTLAKTVRFNVLKVVPNVIFGSARKQFNLF